MSAGPYGAKGASEIVCVPPMAAIANAVFNATGVRIKTLPLSPENVLRGLKARGKRKSNSYLNIRDRIGGQASNLPPTYFGIPDSSIPN